MEQEEELIANVNTEFESARQKKDECQQNLAKYNLNDREMGEKNEQINAEINDLQQSLSAEHKKLEAEKTKYKQKVGDVSDNERATKKIEARIAKVKQTIKTLEDNIKSELNT